MRIQKLVVSVAVMLVATGCAATGGMGGGMMMGGMGGMSHGGAASAPMDHGVMTPATATATLAAMQQRADALVARAKRLMPASTRDTVGHTMMSHESHDAAPSGAESVVHMATGLRGLLQHVDAMHRSGMTRAGDTAAAMHELHQRCAALLGEMEQTVQAMESLHATHR